MHITLIEPPKFYAPTHPISTVVIPPLGLAYIAGSLEAAGHRVHVVDGVAQGFTNFRPFKSVYIRGIPIEEICAQIPKETELIGISSMFSGQWLIVRELAREIKRRFPHVPLVLGGEHSTGMPGLCMEQAPIDLIVTGEGEETIVEVANFLNEGDLPNHIQGTVVRTGNRWIENPRRERIRNIDRIPTPAWHLFNIAKYIEFNQPHGASRGRFMPMLATRGCPFKCNFCTSPTMWTQTWVARAPHLVVDEIELYMNRYNATDFHFEDLTAIVRKDWILSFCKTIIDRKLKITFQLPSGTRSEAVDFETATTMKAAGCHEFSFAPESGDPRVLKAIRKQVDLTALFKSARSAMKAGINVGGLFIVGFPEDNYKSVLRTYWTLAKCAFYGFTSANINAFSPQPNTESFNSLRARGKIPALNDEYFLNLFQCQDITSYKISYNDLFTSREIKWLVILGYAIFYSVYFLRKPWRIFALFHDLIRKTSIDKSSRALSNLIKDFKNFSLNQQSPTYETDP